MKNILRILRMAAFYSFLGLLLQGILVNILLASPVEGQNLHDIKITLNLDQVTFCDAMQVIEKKADLKFLYSSEEIPLEERVTIKVEDESLYNVLLGLAGEFQLVFNRINDQIVVKKVDVQPLPPPPPTGQIKGKITDAKTGEALIGANIMLKGTTTGATTNEEGEYFIEKLTAGTYTLVVKYIGYTTKEETVEVAANRTVEVNIELDPSAFDLNEVVVTGTMVETKKKTLGTAITILKPQDLEKMSTTSLQEIFQDQQVVGVTSMERGSGGDANFNQKIYIRGSNTTQASYIEPTKVLVDGVEVATKFMSNISAQNIERIEIIRGPQASTLYGSEAAGGVIQIFTKKGMIDQQGIKGSISTQQGLIESKYDPKTAWYRSYNGSLTGGFLGGSYSLGVTYIEKDGFADNGDKKNGNVSFGFQKKLLDNLNVSLTTRFNNRKFGYSGASTVFYDLYKKGLLPSSSKYLIDPNDYYTMSSLILGLAASYVYSDWWEHQLTIGYNKDRADAHNIPSNLYAADTILTRSTNDLVRSTFRYSTNIKLPRMGFFQPSITAGFEYIEPQLLTVVNKYRDTGEFSVPSLSGTIQEENTVKRAYFGQAKLGFYDKLFITAGVRTDYNSNNGPNYSNYTTNPRAGFSYLIEPTDGWVIKTRGSWGIGIQSPTLRMRNGGLPTCLPNPDIGPQKTNGWEIGADQYFLDGSLYFEFTYYYQTTEDLIGYDYPDMENNPSQYMWVNLGEVKNKGLELVLKYTQGTMDIGGNVSFNDNEIISMPELKSPSEIIGKPIATSVIPQVSAGFSFNYTLNELLNIDKEHNASIGFNVNYIGKRWALDYEAYFAAALGGSLKSRINYLRWFDGFAKVNLFANYKLTRNLGIRLTVRNLFNSYEQPTPGYYVTGRQSSINLSINF